MGHQITKVQHYLWSLLLHVLFVKVHMYIWTYFYCTCNKSSWITDFLTQEAKTRRQCAGSECSDWELVLLIESPWPIHTSTATRKTFTGTCIFPHKGLVVKQNTSILLILWLLLWWRRVLLLVMPMWQHCTCSRVWSTWDSSVHYNLCSSYFCESCVLWNCVPCENFLLYVNNGNMAQNTQTKLSKEEIHMYMYSMIRTCTLACK